MDEKIDKTKENLGVSGLDDQTRKKLFDNFVDAGGKVLSEKEKRRSLAIDREKQLKQREQLNRTRGSSSSAGKKKKAPSKKTSNRRIPQQQKKASINAADITDPSTMEKLGIRLRAFFSGVIQFNGFYLSSSFLKTFNDSFRPALLEIQRSYFEIFRHDLSLGQKVTASLDDIRPLYYELIEKSSELADNTILSEIAASNSEYPDSTHPVSSVQEPLIKLYRRMYLLKPYQNTIINAYIKSFELYQKDKKLSNLTTSRKKVKSALQVLFDKLYPKLHLLFCYTHQRYMETFDPRVEALLAITSSERPGNRSLATAENSTVDDTMENEAADSTTEEKTKKEEHSYSEEIRKGLALMSKIDMEALKNSLKKNKPFQQISDDDALQETWLLFLEFDREYSPLLTTTRIKFNKDIGNKGVEDYRAQLNNQYDAIRRSEEALIHYAEILSGYRRTRNDRPISNDQYVSYSKRLEAMEKKKNDAGRMAQTTIRNQMEHISSILEELCIDLQGNRKFIANPDDTLEFNEQIEGKRKLNGLTVSEAIWQIRYFTEALAMRLGYEGDLYGKERDIDLNEFRDESSAAPEKTETKDDTDDLAAEGQSILDELDDLV